MNLDPLSFTLTQINNLVKTLTKKNYNQNTREISQLVQRYGLEADRHLLRCLFSAVDFGDNSGAGKGSAQAQLLSSECGSLLNKPALVSTLCYALDNPLANHKTLKPTPDLLRQISRTLTLSAIQEVILSLALRHSSNPDTTNLAAAHLRLRLPDLIKSYIDTDSRSSQQEGGLHDTSPEVLQLILTSIANGQHTNLGVSEVTRELFLKHLCRDFPRDRVPLVLAPLLYPEETENTIEKMNSVESGLLDSAMSDSAWSELIMEIGYGFTASVEECRNTLINVGGRELTTLDVAKIVAMMARTHSSLSEGTGLQTPGSFWPGSTTETPKEKLQSSSSNDHPTTWKPEIFVQTLKELAPNLIWKEVCVQLDHPEFIVKDRPALNLLFTLLRLGLQSAGVPPNVFPVEAIYRHWNNVEGQLSLVSNILKNSDMFCFADHPFAPVQIDLLKSPPESDSKDVASWRSLHLIELLLFIAENGFYSQVHELFKTPSQACPDVLVLALLQINPPVTQFRQELLTNLMPIFLGNHPNSAIILHHAWHSQNVAIKPVIMHAMAEWYLRGEHDQSRLSRILDVAQDLKALSMLLNARSFMFVIDLACLASRREYLKLEKWLTDKIREHGEPFVTATVKFLQRRCPQLMGGKISEEQIPKAAQLPHDTIATMLGCLQGCLGNVQPDLAEAIISMTTNCNILMNNTRQQPPPPVMRTHRTLETPFNPSSLGGQLFNGPNVDSIAALGSNIANLNLGAPGNASFNLPSSLGPLVSTPGSPSRLLSAGPSNSPFPMMSLQHSGSVGGGPSLVQGVNALSGLGRMGPTSGIDKPRLPEAPTLFPDIATNVSKEIEDEANSYFQRIYNHPPHPTLSIDEVLDMLKKFQDSPAKREREVFSCMLRNLFEEYRFFPQYPDKELHITAQLFGGIIERGLVSSYMALGMALRFVLDALRKPDGTKMYFFGIAALDRFKSRLKDYHKYCEHVRAIPHFNEFPGHLIEYVDYGLQSLEPPNKPQGQVLPTNLATLLTNNSSAGPPYRTTNNTTPVTTSTIAKSVTTSTSSNALSTRPSIANATNIDTLLVATEREEKMTAPPESVQDKTAFIFNNLSQLNLQPKCDEIRDIITEEYWPWISQYLVMKRASIELNFHALYSNFLDVLKIPEVNNIVTKETFRNIKVLLRSDKGIANFSDRSLLKNLGHWLGMLTLGRSRPILQVDIDLKSLLVEAYHKGQQELLYVVPFVAKVLEACAKSRVFKPPNPWTMAIMNVLAELHQEQDLKLNLKFEIEVLCKNLNIDVADLKPAIYLKDPERVRMLEYQLSHPNKPKDTIISQLPNLQTIPVPVQSASSGNVSSDELIQPSAGTPTNAGGNSDSSNSGGSTNGPPEPRFNYMDITLNSGSCIAQHINISPMILLFQTHPHLKQYIRPSIERSIQEWILPVVDRSIKIALTTSEQIIRKDFALDPDEIRMRTSAHHMVRNLSAGMAMITCRDQLLASINTNLKTAFLTAMVSATPQQKEVAETAATTLATDNMELACAFVQKTAIEKAITEIDKRLMSDYELRKIARQEGRRYCDPMALTYQAERMPEQIRLKVGGMAGPQIAVYEEFARNIPGFMPLSERDAAAIFLPKTLTQEPLPVTPFPQSSAAAATQGQLTYGIDEMGALYDKLITDVEKFLSAPLTMALTLQASATHNLLECLLLARRNREIITAMALLQKAVENLLEGLTPMPETPEPMIRFRELHMRVLKMLQDPRAYGMQWTNKHITRCLSECREDIRYNLDAVDCLVRSHLVNLQQYDVILTQCMDNGNNYMAVAYAMSLVQLYLIDERLSTHVTEADFFNTIEMLARMAVHSRQPPEGLATLIDMLRANHDSSSFLGDRAPGGPTSHIHSGILQVRASDDDPPGLLDKTDVLLREWVQIYHTPQASRDPTKAFSIFVHQMNVHGILKTDDLITRFFRLSTQLCVEHVYRSMNETSLTPTMLRAKAFSWVDAFVRLVSLLVKHSGDSGNTSTKINLLNKVLGIVAGCLLQDHESQGTAFQQLPYHRIFIMLFLELNAPEPVLDSINFQVLTAFCHTMHILRPSKGPGFCYAWLELISHRVFIGRMLAITPQQKGWGMYAQLLIDLFKYLAPFLRNAELAKPVALLYKGTLRVLLVLLHDFPEFLCDYHYGFCDVIPPNCIQMRNLILSAFPRNMRLPDPFTPNLKVDMLSEISHAPRVLTNYASIIQPVTFKKDLDSYLKARAPVTFLSELRSNMQISNEPGLRYNIPLMNAVVLYVGTQAIAYIRSKGQTPNMSTIVHSAHMDIFQNLAVDLDNEGRYLFLNAIANQLRYPNSHTHYFSCALLYLFVEANTEAIQEQITRVLLERLIVNRPHPWGLLITFIELIKNPSYKFWDHDFVHCAPEIEKLFESVARSCMVVKTPQPAVSDNELPE